MGGNAVQRPQWPRESPGGGFSAALRGSLRRRGPLRSSDSLVTRRPTLTLGAQGATSVQGTPLGWASSR